MADPSLAPDHGPSSTSYPTVGQGLSGNELRDLIDVLQEPLQGRSVLVPFGSQAFFEGTLDPTNATRGPEGLGPGEERKPDLDRGDEGAEYVLLRTSARDNKEEFAELKVTRQQARDLLLQSERDSLMRAKRLQPREAETASSSQVEAAKALPSGNEKAEKRATLSSSSPGNNTHPARADDNDQFFEIREELDASGKEIRAEAVNVSKQLEMLESESSTGERKATDSDSLKPAIGDHDGDYKSSSSDDLAPHKRVLSDAEYDKLAARLDELARLEEQSEKSKAVNVASRKSLQGGGWSSGFLNKSKAGRKGPVAGSATVRRAIQPARKEVESSPMPSGRSTEGAAAASARRVGFNPQANQVREIPRVGERSAAEIRKKPALFSQQRTTSDGQTSLPSSAVGGVVRERSRPSKKPSALSAPLTPADPSPPKRLSRFAQERLEQQQQQQQPH